MLQDVTRLRLLDQVKSNLVATASHELKTPLTSLRLAVHLLLEESIGPLNPKQTELLLDARENSERLLAMINNLLDLARLEQGSRQLDLEPASPGTLLATLPIASVREPTIKASNSRSTSLPHCRRSLSTSRGSATRCGICWTTHSLILTAGEPSVSARADASEVILSVSDTGCGIPLESVPHVFEKFFRVPGQSRGGGTGLGLAIVHEIVTAHGGSVECESQPSVGTTFRLRLPIAPSDVSRRYALAGADGSVMSPS